MRRLWQSEFFFQTFGSSMLDKGSPADRPDDSPVSVIAPCAIISHPSSSCASMEHQVSEDGRLFVHQENGYSNSGDDVACNLSTKVEGPDSMSETLLSFSSMELFDGRGKLVHDPAPKARPSVRKISSGNSGLPSDKDQIAIQCSDSVKHRSVKDQSSIFCNEVQGLTTTVGDQLHGDSRQCAGHKENDNGKHVGIPAYMHYSLQRPEETASNKQAFACRLKPETSKDRLRSINPSTNGRNSVQPAKQKVNVDEGPQVTVARAASFKPSLRPTRACVRNVVASRIDRDISASLREDNAVWGAIGMFRASKALPFKWDDAGRWLFNTASLSHPGFANGQSNAPPTVITPENESNAALSSPVSETTECSYGTAGIIGSSRTFVKSHEASTSDSELLKSPRSGEYSRSSSARLHNKQQVLDGESLLASKKCATELVECVGDCTTINIRKETSHDPESNLQDASGADDTWVSARACDGHNDQKSIDGDGRAVFNRLPSNSIDRNELRFAGQVGEKRTETLAQDKYANSVVETLIGCDEDDSSFPLRTPLEFVVRTPSNGRSTSMKDASTEISPSVSQREIGTQIAFSEIRFLASRCGTPMEIMSPAKHNTPIRQRSPSTCSNAKLNLLELESHHLAKLELGDLPPGSQLVESFHKSVSNDEDKEAEVEHCKCLNFQHFFGIKRSRRKDDGTSTCENARLAKTIAKHRREEAMIDAWENLQRAKAEAALKKMELKLEQLRSDATEKIMSKLRASTRRAQEMRAAVADAHHGNQRTKRKRESGWTSALCFIGVLRKF